jgi:hypothetical protein
MTGFRGPGPTLRWDTTRPTFHQSVPPPGHSPDVAPIGVVGLGSALHVGSVDTDMTDGVDGPTSDPAAGVDTLHGSARAPDDRHGRCSTCRSVT